MSFAKTLLLSLFILFPFGQLVRLPLGVQGVSIYVHDAILVLLWLWLIFTYKREVLSWFRRGIGKKVCIFTSLAFLSWILAVFRWKGHSLLSLGYLVRFIAFTGVYFAVDKLIEEGQVGRKEVINWLRNSILWTAIFGWVQYFLLPDLTFMKYLGWDDHYYRLTGTFLDPNFMGIILVLGLGLEFREKRFGLWRKLFLLLTLAFTYSRASYLGWLILLIAWMFQKILGDPIKKDILFVFRFIFRPLKTALFVFWILVTLVIFHFLPRPAGEGGNLLRTASTNARLTNWQQSWEIIKKNPIVGVGFNNYQLVSPGNQKADNTFLLVWATTGILGLISFLWLSVSFKPWWIFLPLFFHSLFNNSFFYPWIMIFVWSIHRE